MFSRLIPEYPGADGAGRLGRHVRHDPRSLSYTYVARSLGSLTSVRHQRYIPVLNQGDVGACTGNAALGAVGTGGLFEALNLNTLQPSTSDAEADERRAVEIYSQATEIDDFDGTYPPEDTGSSGLAAAKVAQRMGLISGYRHATSLEAALTALNDQAVITGINWYESFDSPSDDGLISITKGASVRGGHEVCLDTLDAENRLVWFTNSWSESWGLAGRASLSWDDFGRLLGEKGDVTIFTPVNEPPPAPDPAPGDELTGCLGTILSAAHKALNLVKGKTP